MKDLLATFNYFFWVGLPRAIPLLALGFADGFPPAATGIGSGRLLVIFCCTIVRIFCTVQYSTKPDEKLYRKIRKTKGRNLKIFCWVGSAAVPHARLAAQRRQAIVDR